MTRATVLGAGAWGSTFAAVLADAGCEVTVWGRDAAVCRQITEENRNERYLPGVELPASVTGESDLQHAVKGAEVVAVAVPAQSARAALTPVAGHLDADAVAVSLMKGVELSTHQRMSELLTETLRLPAGQVAVLSGPNLADEIAVRQPTATVVAATDQRSAERVAQACACSYFRPYTNDDVVGVELCGAVKNVIALAVGISQGQGFGYNTMATVITRGLVEITRLGLALGARAETFGGLAGMGDLMATCASPQSRNHRLGVHIGQGLTLEQAVIATGGTAEGVKTSRSVLDLATRAGVEMPITAAVVRVLFEELPVSALAPLLLERPRKAEGQ